MEEQIKQANPTLHKYLFTVTTFSKLLAMFLFILLPFVGLYLGIKYQELKIPIISPVKQQAIPHTRPANPRSDFSIKSLGNANMYFENKDNHFSFEYPESLTISSEDPNTIVEGLTEVMVLSKISPNGTQHYALVDGLVMNIATSKKDSKTNFMEYVKKRVYTAPEVEYFKPIDYGKLKGYEGKITNVNGTMREVFLAIPESSDYYFFVLVQAEGPNKTNYDNMANKIISTLNYIK